MAKKKRKHFIKLNNKIRELFGELPFDEGITTLSDDALLELVLLLGLDTSSLVRDENIRLLRRVWSEGNFSYRKAIVDHLSGKKPLRQIKETPPASAIDKVDKIVSLLNHFQHDREEEQMILESFVEMRAGKITLEKIEHKLIYIRLQRRVKQLEEALDAHFNNRDEMEFYHAFSFDFPTESFSKTLLVRSYELDWRGLLKQTDEEIISILLSEKTTLITQKKEEIALFLAALPEHPYITPDEA